MEWVCECASHLQVTWSCQFSSQFQLGNFLWMQKSPGKCKSCPSICLVSHRDCVSVFSVSGILQQGGFQAIGCSYWHVHLVLEEAVSIQSPCVLPATGKLSRAVSSLLGWSGLLLAGRGRWLGSWDDPASCRARLDERWDVGPLLSVGIKLFGPFNITNIIVMLFVRLCQCRLLVQLSKRLFWQKVGLK